jgi:hypothetical protein
MFTLKHHLAAGLFSKIRKGLASTTPKSISGSFSRSKIMLHYPKAIRYILHGDKLKKVLGTNLAVLTLASNLIPLGSISEQNIEQVVKAPIVLTTEKTVQYPVNIMRITQNYRFYHPGLDIDGTTGDIIMPIMKGKVVEAGRSKIGYGNYVVIDHENGYRSLYAHLSKIEVTVGNLVTLETVIGKMGSTGRSSGDHLHLEVYEGEKRINPLTILKA